jgi:uncharacterized membrane protein
VPPPSSLVASPAQVYWRMGMTVFSLLGALVALYLWLSHLGLSKLACPVAGCEVVQASAYSSILGVPVATIGFFAFTALFAASLTSVLLEHVQAERFVFVVSSLGLLAYLWFTYLELFVIKAICFWCVVSSFTMLGAWVCAWMASRQPTTVRTRERSSSDATRAS